MPARAAGVSREVTGVPPGARRKRVGERVRVGMRKGGSADARRIEQVLFNVGGIRGQGDKIPILSSKGGGKVVLAGIVPFMTGIRIRQMLKFMFWYE